MFLNSFVKRGRPLSKAKKLLLEETLPRFRIEIDALPSLIKKYKKINLEIGFGKGEFLVALSQQPRSPSLRAAKQCGNLSYYTTEDRLPRRFAPRNDEEGDTILNIGCEVYIEGVVRLLQKIKEQEIKNIMLWPDDARLLITNLSDHSLDTIYILFPDPWPKKRQQKRRIINQEFINLISKKLKTTGEIFFATDHHEYADWTLEHFKQSKKFLCEDISKDSKKFFYNSVTNYHKKNLEDAEIKLFRFSSLFE